MFGANNDTTTNSVHDVILGSSNKDIGAYSQGDNVIIGVNNTIGNSSHYGVCVGHGNNGTCNMGILIGTANKCGAYIGARLVGDGLVCSIGNQFIVGRYNATPSLSDARFIIGIGTGSDAKKNAVEIGNSNNTFKIRCNLALETDATEVNAITPPQDPNNITQDDQTLVTVSHMNAEFSKSQVAYFSDFDTALSVPLDNTSVDFATSFGTPPTWANRALITFRWENELIQKEIHFTKNEGIHLNIVQRAYSTFPETVVHKHLRLEWDFTAKTLTAADYWTYDQDMSNNGAISNWDHTLTNASVCKVLSVVYSQ